MPCLGCCKIKEEHHECSPISVGSRRPSRRQTPQTPAGREDNPLVAAPAIIPSSASSGSAGSQAGPRSGSGRRAPALSGSAAAVSVAIPPAGEDEPSRHASSSASTSRQDVHPTTSRERSTQNQNEQRSSRATDTAAARRTALQHAKGPSQARSSDPNESQSAPLNTHGESARPSPGMPHRSTGAGGPQLLRARNSPPERRVSPQRRPTPRSEAAAGTSKSYAAPEVRVGIETEFYLAARFRRQRAPRIDQFVCMLADCYNEKYPKQPPQMMSTLHPWEYKRRYEHWSMVSDKSIETPVFDSQPWPLEMVSPILRTSSDGSWRSKVHSVWEVLRDYYVIMGNDSCSTHVHVSLKPQWNLSDILRFAQAVIHFEPAIEAIVPQHRRGNEYAGYNWLNGTRLALEGKSRRESIAIVGKATSVEGLLMLMQEDVTGTGFDRHYAWNFASLLDTSKQTVEFRKPPVSLKVDDVLCWTELAMTFALASFLCKSTEALQKVPATVGGLRWFLQQAQYPKIHEPFRLERLWAGRDPGGAVAPHITGYRYFGEHQTKVERANKLAREDLKHIVAYAKTVQEPYW